MSVNPDKTESLHFRVSGHEKVGLKQVSEELGVKQSVFLRRLLRSVISRGPNFWSDEKKELKRLRLEIAKVGTNLNQIAKRINSGQCKADPVSAAEIASLKAAYADLNGLMKTMLDTADSRRVRLHEIARLPDL